MFSHHAMQETSLISKTNLGGGGGRGVMCYVEHVMGLVMCVHKIGRDLVIGLCY